MDRKFMSRLVAMAANSNQLGNDELETFLFSLREQVDECISNLNDHRDAIGTPDKTLDATIRAWDEIGHVLEHPDSTNLPKMPAFMAAIQELCEATVTVIETSIETHAVAARTIH